MSSCMMQEELGDFTFLPIGTGTNATSPHLPYSYYFEVLGTDISSSIWKNNITINAPVGQRCVLNNI